MGITSVDHDVESFVIQLISTGVLLSELVADLAEALPPDSYPGEEHEAVVLEMIYGTITTALGSVEPSDLRRGTELIGIARERVIEHLQLARELSRRLENDRGGGRTYG